MTRRREETAFRVLVIGGSYAGLAATVNLLDLCRGLPCRFPTPSEAPQHRQQVPVQIIIVDERHGFCTYIKSWDSFRIS